METVGTLGRVEIHHKTLNTLKNALKPLQPNALKQFSQSQIWDTRRVLLYTSDFKRLNLRKEKEYYCKLRFKSFK